MKKRKEQDKRDELVEKIERYQQDSFSPEDYLEVSEAFNKPSFQFRLQQSLYRIWCRIVDEDTNDQPDLESTLDKLHHRIGLYEESRSRTGVARKIFIAFSRIAAILIIPLGITTFLYIYEKSVRESQIEGFIEINVPGGSRIKTQLPDGSAVWLNSGTTLEYPQNYNKRNRMAKVSGEAYFEITPDRMHPFRVETGTFDVKVLGTSFNVRSYPEEGEASTTLEEGRLSVEQIENGKMVKRYCFVEPGQRVVYSKADDRVVKAVTDTEKYTSWKEGKLVFRNDPLHIVIRKLEKWYNAEIEVSDATLELPQHPFTLTIENETLPQVLEFLAVASPIKWESLPPEYTENGRIKITKYIISKR
jgi:hypothetical protein